MSRQTILVIEDEKPLAEILTYNLTKEGFEVTNAHDGREGLGRARTLLPDLVLLDLMLPVMEGLEVCRQLRGDPKTKHVPILMLTAKSEEVDEIVGFQVGADDYVTKPFRIKPLMQRIKALLRRGDTNTPSGDVANCHGIEVDRFHHRTASDGVELQLTPTEFRLLWTLIRQPGRAFTRQQLMEAGIGDDSIVLERTIDVHVEALRRKLEGKADLIETVRGVGYRFQRTLDGER